VNTLRHVKTEVDMTFDQSMQPGILPQPYDMNMNQGFYRGPNNSMGNSQYRMPRGGLQKSPFQNQAYHHNNMNNKRYFNNNTAYNVNYQVPNPNMASESSMSQTNGNLLNNTNNTSNSQTTNNNSAVSINANGDGHNNEPCVGGVGMNGFEITMGTVADINLEDIQNDANNQSDDSEFEYSSCDENLIDMYYQDPQVRIRTCYLIYFCRRFF